MHKALDSISRNPRNQACWETSVLPAFRRQKQEYNKFKIIPSYIVNLRPP